MHKSTIRRRKPAVPEVTVSKAVSREVTDYFEFPARRRRWAKWKFARV